ncbi:unnamed protein product [Closterium sp. NIES-64]|nr:unnamed protein product [Closterium sp. NIES-64]
MKKIALDPEALSQYWGIKPKQYLREDGTPWPWNSFRPTDSYTANRKTELDRHFPVTGFGDAFAKYLVKSLRFPTDLFFQKRYGCRAMMLETVAAVPGMVAGVLLHMRCLRLVENSGGWIRALLEEAENERMHLMTFMQVSKPTWFERGLIFTVQSGFAAVYGLVYLLSPRIAHRIVGYLEEEAVHSYTQYLKEIDEGRIANVPAPQIAIDYWQLPKDATLYDVVLSVRADEAHHRDVNHYAATIIKAGKHLKEHPAPNLHKLPPRLCLSPSPAIALTFSPSPAIALTFSPSPAIALTFSPSPAIALTFSPSPAISLTFSPSPAIALTFSPSPAIALTFSPSPAIALTFSPSPAIALTFSPSPAIALTFSPSPAIALTFSPSPAIALTFFPSPAIALTFSPSPAIPLTFSHLRTTFALMVSPPISLVLTFSSLIAFSLAPPVPSCCPRVLPSRPVAFALAPPVPYRRPRALPSPMPLPSPNQHLSLPRKKFLPSPSSPIHSLPFPSFLFPPSSPLLPLHIPLSPSPTPKWFLERVLTSSHLVIPVLQRFFRDLFATGVGAGLTVRHTSDMGRGVFADVDFKEGDVVLQEPPLVSMQHSHNRARALVCSHCLRFIGPLEQAVARLLTWQKGMREEEEVEKGEEDQEDAKEDKEEKEGEEGSKEESPGAAAAVEGFIEQLSSGQLKLPHAECVGTLPSAVPCPGGCTQETFCSDDAVLHAYPPLSPLIPSHYPMDHGTPFISATCATSAWADGHAMLYKGENLLCLGHASHAKDTQALKAFYTHADGEGR